MSLSDACYDFTQAVVCAAKELQGAVETYGGPEFGYSAEEILSLRVACANAHREPWNSDAAVILIRLSQPLRRTTTHYRAARKQQDDEPR